MSSTPAHPAEPTVPPTEQPSCYLLEFSVMPGGARLGDVHAHGDLAGVRAGFERRYDVGDPVGDYFVSSLVVWYGAVLHLWVVRHGVVVDGIDLHPYLRTGDDRYDRTLARAAGSRGDDLFDLVCEVFDSPVAALPLLDRIFELRDRIDAGDGRAEAELEELIDPLYDFRVPEAFRDSQLTGLTLDWDAIAAAAPSLPEPLLAGGHLTLRWPPTAAPLPADSHLRLLSRIHAGVNDTENGDDEYPDASH